MSEQKIEEITNILKEQVGLSSALSPAEDHHVKKFIPHPPSFDEIKRADPEKSGANLILITKGQVDVNTLTPREQEKEGKFVVYLFVREKGVKN
jgi:hypothetical protein